MRIPAIRAISLVLAALLVIPSAALGVQDETASSRAYSAGSAGADTVRVGTPTGLLGRHARPESEEQPVAAEDELIVVFDRDSDPSTRIAAHKVAGTKLVRRVRVAGAEAQLVELAPGSDKSRVERAYRSMRGVSYIQPNFLYRAAAVNTPNDPFFFLQWSLRNMGGGGATFDADIDGDEAWVEETGSEDIVVAVLDTGIAYAHNDLASNMWTNADEIAGNGVDDDHNGYVDDVRGWDFVGRDADPSDWYGHGTHVAGIIGAQGNNAEGIAGVAWDVKLMPLKILSDITGQGDSMDAIEAIEYAAANGADVINASWGVALTSSQLDDTDQLLRETIEASGVLFVAAAGNSSRNNDGYLKFYPASFRSDNIISVAGSNELDVIDWLSTSEGYSNYGLTSVDLAAPGTSIPSAIGLTYLVDDYFDSLDNWIATSTVTPWTDTYDGGEAPEGAAVLANYGDNELAQLTLKEPLDLSAPGEYELGFTRLVNSQAEFDVLRCEVSTDGVTWDTLATISGNRPLHPYFDRLQKYVGKPSVHVRFTFETDESSGPASGSPLVVIDDFYVVHADGVHGDTYVYMTGTSMAAPHVTGAAALALSVNPNLNATSLKRLLMDTVDKIGSHAGKTVTGGRLNAAKAVAAAPSAPLVAGVNRLAARDRYATALAIAKRAHPSWIGVTNIVIASGEDRSAADPLAAAGLVWAYGGAPLILVSSTSVPWSVQDELEEIAEKAPGPIRLHVVGGTSAIPDDRVAEIEAVLENRGATVEDSNRIGGANRYDTARKIAEEMVAERGAEMPDDVLIANGANPASFYDALALSPISAMRGTPILLVSQSAIPAETMSMLGTLSPNRVVIGGGVNTVSEAVAVELGTSGPVVERWAGRNRYETATTIAENAVAEGLLAPDAVTVSASLADALSSASISGIAGGPLLLTSNTSLASATGTWLSAHAGEISQVWVLGGTNSVPAGQDTAIAGLLN